jgi:hypothetical protein
MLRRLISIDSAAPAVCRPVGVGTDGVDEAHLSGHDSVKPTRPR